jgi:hypothetical protein
MPTGTMLKIIRFSPFLSVVWSCQSTSQVRDNLMFFSWEAHRTRRVLEGRWKRTSVICSVSRASSCCSQQYGATGHSQRNSFSWGGLDVVRAGGREQNCSALEGPWHCTSVDCSVLLDCNECSYGAERMADRCRCGCGQASRAWRKRRRGLCVWGSAPGLPASPTLAALPPSSVCL